MRTWLSNTRDLLQTKLWPTPSIAVALALLLGFGLPRLDAAVDGEVSSDLVFGADADAARSLLGAIASSLITVTALTFSLTVVTLQLASSQFSPRLLRTFARDQFVQATLALFLATFTYALTVLRAVRGSDGGERTALVPQIAVSFAFVLAVASVVVLVLFLAHLTEQIRVETMLRGVHRDAMSTMRSELPERRPDSPDHRPGDTPRPPAGARHLLVVEGGFVTSIDNDRLLAIAEDEDVQVSLDAHPGSFLVVGTPLGNAWPAAGGRLDGESTQRVAGRVAGCVGTSFERTEAQDVGFGLRQLTDVANKALSPGINDPTTAIHALGHISAFLCSLTERVLGDVLLRDAGGRVRVVMRRPDLAGYVDLGISQPRRYGAGDPQVLEKIAQVLLDLSHHVTRDQHPVVREQLRRLRATVDTQPFDVEERAGLDRLGNLIEQTLRGPGTKDDG
jgi:uncharacterized membrane protein